MKCPHCDVGVSLYFNRSVWKRDDFEKTGMGYGIFYARCPECDKLVVLFKEGRYKEEKSSGIYSEPYLEEVILEDHLS